MKYPLSQKGVAWLSIVFLLALSAVGAVGSVMLIDLVGVANLSTPLLSAIAVLGLMIMPTVQLLIKLHDLGGHEALSVSEHRSLEFIVTEKSRRLWAFVTYLIVTGVICVVASTLAKLDGVFAFYAVVIAGVLLLLAIYFFIYVLLQFRELTEFKWKIEQRHMEQKRRAEVMNKFGQGAGHAN